LHYGFGTEFYKYFVFDDPDWDYTHYDFSTWADDVAETATLLDATEPDLGPFRDAGGKLILWTGWSDPALTALGTIDYYEQVIAGDPSAREYARLFMLPGVLHLRRGTWAGPGRLADRDCRVGRGGRTTDSAGGREARCGGGDGARPDPAGVRVSPGRRVHRFGVDGRRENFQCQAD